LEHILLKGGGSLLIPWHIWYLPWETFRTGILRLFPILAPYFGRGLNWKAIGLNLAIKGTLKFEILGFPGWEGSLGFFYGGPQMFLALILS